MERACLNASTPIGCSRQHARPVFWGSLVACLLLLSAVNRLESVTASGENAAKGHPSVPHPSTGSTRAAPRATY